MANNFLNVKETALRLGISQHTIRAWIRERRIPFHRMGNRILFLDTDLETLIARSRVIPWGEKSGVSNER